MPPVLHVDISYVQDTRTWKSEPQFLGASGVFRPVFPAKQDKRHRKAHARTGPTLISRRVRVFGAKVVFSGSPSPLGSYHDLTATLARPRLRGPRSHARATLARPILRGPRSHVQDCEGHVRTSKTARATPARTTCRGMRSFCFYQDQ